MGAVPWHGGDSPADRAWEPHQMTGDGAPVVVLTLWSFQCSVAFARVALARRDGRYCAGTVRVELTSSRFWRPAAYPLADPYV